MPRSQQELDARDDFVRKLVLPRSVRCPQLEGDIALPFLAASLYHPCLPEMDPASQTELLVHALYLWALAVSEEIQDVLPAEFTQCLWVEPKRRFIDAAYVKTTTTEQEICADYDGVRDRFTRIHYPQLYVLFHRPEFNEIKFLDFITARIIDELTIRHGPMLPSGKQPKQPSAPTNEGPPAKKSKSAVQRPHDASMDEDLQVRLTAQQKDDIAQADALIAQAAYHKARAAAIDVLLSGYKET